jgi:hypothetical protein
VHTDSDEHEVEDLLRQVFDDARRRGGRGIDGLYAGALERARRARRRRAVLGGGGAGLAAASVVTAVFLGPGLDAAKPKDPGPAGTATTASASRWDALLDYGYPFHYRIPDVEPDPRPQRVEPLSFPPRSDLPGDAPTTGTASSAGASAAVEPGSLDDADLAGVAGYCNWSEQDDRRRPVAGKSWQYQTHEYRGSYSAGLGIAGFATGTGRDALADMRRGALACAAAPDLKPVEWPGMDSGDVMLLAHTGSHLDAKQTTVLAVRRVGDILVSGSAKSSGADEARRIATELADRTASELVETGFPPALGQPLGRSALAPNEASRVGAEQRPPMLAPAEYLFGDVFPAEADLPGRMTYHGDPSDYRRTPPARGAQMCDGIVVAEEAPGQEDGPEPVAGKSQSAWAASGLPAHPSADLVVTGWARGTGAARFADLQSNRGTCIWQFDQTREDWPGADPGRTWLSTTPYGGAVQYVAAQRVGDVIVSAVVVAPSRVDARNYAIALSDKVAQKVRASGIPAAKGK